MERGTFIPQKKKILIAWSRDEFWRLLSHLDALDALPLTPRVTLGDKPVVPPALRMLQFPGFLRSRAEENTHNVPAIKKPL